MTETGQIILGICILIIVYILTRKLNIWRIRRTYVAIAKDLEAKKAFGPDTAVDLSYARRNVFRVGLRDFRPEALKHLVANGIVGVTDEGKYFLRDRRIAILNE